MAPGEKNKRGKMLVGRELMILGRRGRRGEAPTGGKRKMGIRSLGRLGWAGELSKRQKAGRRVRRGIAYAVPHQPIHFKA